MPVLNPLPASHKKAIIALLFSSGTFALYAFDKYTALYLLLNIIKHTLQDKKDSPIFIREPSLLFIP